MGDDTDDRTLTNRRGRPETTKTDRRSLLKKGLLVAGVGATVASTGTTDAAATTEGATETPEAVATVTDPAKRTAHDAGRFEIWAADHLEFDYRFQAEGPVEPIAHPADDIGAEIGPDGNDIVEYIGDGLYRGRGTTGLGKNDLWRSGTLDKIVITDCRK